jgi:uncharacterized protein
VSEPYVLIVVTSSVLGLVAGFIMHRADFCVTAMFRDFFLFRDATLLRALVLLIASSMLLFELGRLTGLIRLYPFPILGVPTLANLLGSMLFGFGMVLAGGCVFGTLYKMGSGSVLSAAAFVGLLAGSAVYAEFHPWWAAFGKSTAFTQAGITLPQALGVSPTWLIVPLLALAGIYLWKWYRANQFTKPAVVEGFMQPWRVALALSVIGLISYALVGMPLGITTSYAKLGGILAGLVAPEHIAQLAYFKAMPLSYTPPFASEAIKGGPGPALDAIAAIQYPLILTIVLGAAFSAMLLGEFRLYYKQPAVQYVSAVAGGLLVGMGARMSSGCNIWHLWGGIPILANQSLIFLMGMLPGAWLGSHFLARFVIR